MKHLLLAVAAFVSASAAAQLSVGYNHSNLPFVGVGYDLLKSGRLRPEVRFGLDNLIDVTTVELVATYAFFRREDYEAYAGAGLRFGFFEGVPALLGVRAYPFASERVGFQIETAGLFPVNADDGVVLRGSLGVQVRLGALK